MDAYTGKRESPVRVATMGDDWTGVGVIACQRIAAPQWSFLAEMRGRLGKKIHTKKYGTQTQSLVRFDNSLRCIRCKTSQASLQL